MGPLYGPGSARYHAEGVYYIKQQQRMAARRQQAAQQRSPAMKAARDSYPSVSQSLYARDARERASCGVVMDYRSTTGAHAVHPPPPVSPHQAIHRGVAGAGLGVLIGGGLLGPCGVLLGGVVGWAMGYRW